MQPKQIIDGNADEKSGCIPTRYVMAFMIFSCCFLSYLVRTDINLTIVTMVNQTDGHSDNETIDESDQCRSDGEDDNALPINNTNKNAYVTYDWDTDTQSEILSSFYYGYLSTQALGGFLSERLGPKWLIGGATLASAILTLLTPLTASWNVNALIALRVVTGLTQGVVFPSCITFINAWIPAKERSTITMAAFSGTSIGTIFAMEVGGYLCKYGFSGGWPSVYYVFGSLAAIWFIFWAVFAFDSPEKHPRISEKEKLQLRDIVIVQNTKQPFPWKSIATSLPVLAFIVAQSCSAWTIYIILTELPTYLNRVLNFPVEQDGSINASVYVIGAFVNISAAKFADWYITRDRSKSTITRKMMQNFGHYGSAICFLCIPLVGCNRALVITLLIVAKVFFSVAPVSDMNIISDMAPSYSGTLYGIGNTLGSVMGLLAPIITGVFTKNGIRLLSNWTWMFCITAAIEVFGSIFFLIFADAEKQSWATQSEDKESLIHNERKIDGRDS